MANLPSEIILDEILPKLPVKSLIRFKCVSKGFKTLISSPEFTNLHLRNSLSSDANRLLIPILRWNNSGLHTFDLDSPETPPARIPLPDILQPYSLVGSSNGLLCILHMYTVDFWLINPFTGFYSGIPYGGVPGLCYGFGYDPLTDDYKVLAIYNYGIMIYSVKNKISFSVENSQENEDFISDVIVNDYNKNAVVVDDHLCHWLFWCRLQQKHRIVCFDLCSERWTRDVPLPNYHSSTASSGSGSGSDVHFADLLFETWGDKRRDVTNLAVLDGCLSVVTVSKSHSMFDLWVMKQYGVVESWVKLFVVPNQRFSPLAFGRGLNCKGLIGTSKSGNHGKLAWCNIRNKGYRKAELCDVKGVGRLYEACLFKGSLVPVPHGKRMA